MKKQFNYLFMAAIALGLTACNNGDTGVNNEPTAPGDAKDSLSNYTTPTVPRDPKYNPLSSEVPTSSEGKKAYLEHAATYCMGMFDVTDQKEVVESLEQLTYDINEYSWDTQGFEDFWDEMEQDWCFVAPRYMAAVASGDPSSITLIQHTFNLAKFAYRFEANSSTRKWRKIGLTPDGSAQLVYTDGKKVYEAKVWGEGLERTYSYTYYYRTNTGQYYNYQTFMERNDGSATEQHTVTGTVPQHLYFTLSCDGKQLAKLQVDNDIVENDHYNMNIIATVANLNYITYLRADHNHAKAIFGMNYGNQALIYSEVNLPSYEVSKKAIGETYEEYGEFIGKNWEQIVNKTGAASVYLNLMGTIQVKALAKNVASLYDEYQNWEDQYSGGYYYQSFGFSYLSREAARSITNMFNQEFMTGIYYGNDTLQAKLILEPYITGSSSRYDIEPLLYFPMDETKYSFTEYFTKRRFINVIDMAEDVANAYRLLIRKYSTDPIEF